MGVSATSTLPPAAAPADTSTKSGQFLKTTAEEISSLADAALDLAAEGVGKLERFAGVSQVVTNKAMVAFDKLSATSAASREHLERIRFGTPQQRFAKFGEILFKGIILYFAVCHIEDYYHPLPSYVLTAMVMVWYVLNALKEVKKLIGLK